MLSLLLINYILPGMLLVAKSLLCNGYLMLISLMAIFSSNILPTTIHLLPPPTVKASVYLLGSQNICTDLCKIKPQAGKTPLGIPWIRQGLLMEVKHSSYKMGKWIKMLFSALLNKPAGFGVSHLPKSPARAKEGFFPSPPSCTPG